MQNRSNAYTEPLAAAMTPADLKAWRRSRGLIQRDAGALLGIAKRTFVYLERGETRGGHRLVTIPRWAELAIKGLDAEMAAAYGVNDEAGLRAAYARAIVAIEDATPMQRHETLGRMGKEIEKKSA